MRKGTTLYYLLSDHLVSTSIVTFENGNLVSQTKYKAWGEVRHQSGPSLTEYTLRQAQGIAYTGQYSYTGSFGLMFYNARWYDPSLGRFAQADSIVPPGVQGLDRYAYVNNSPMNYVDPSGHISCSSVAEDDCSFETMTQEQVVKANIKSKFGIEMSEESDSHNPHPKKWNLNNLRIFWGALNQINNVALNGKLKELAGGATFNWGEYADSDCNGGSYCGRTYGTTIEFFNVGQANINLQNIFHEFAHVLDNSSKTYNAFSHAEGINNPKFLDKYGKLMYSALINQSGDMYQDNLPLYNGDMVKAQNEHWADMFANYVAGNIDLDSPEGRAMNRFVEGALCPYTGIPCP